MWAYLIATKWHDSQAEHPPAKRFFGKSASTKNKRRQDDSDREDAPTADLASSRAAENAPGRENERDKIMRQLRELCHLRDIGGVTEEEFTREQAKLAKILSTAEWCVLRSALFLFMLVILFASILALHLLFLSGSY